MNSFFLVLELLLYAFTTYLILYKKELGFVYLPALFFVFSVINPIAPIGFFYTSIAIYLFATLYKRPDLLSQNAWSLLLIFYFLVLLLGAKPAIKYSLVFSALMLFASIPLIGLIYKNHSRNQVFTELTRCAILILTVFVLNALMSTLHHFNPRSMYGIYSGVLYGNLGYTQFNVIGLALFVVLSTILKKNNWLLLALYVLAFAFVMLTLRRSAMLLSGLSVVLAFFTIATPRNLAKMLIYFLAIAAIGTMAYFKSDLALVFNERYELRRLDERVFEEEKRFAEYEMIYKDMFVIKKYSPWFGFGLFDSAGNYGQGEFDDRTLHGDLPSIAHSSGLIGVLLYLLMMITAFYKSLMWAKTREEVVTVFYCILAFGIFTVTGRYSQTDAMIMLFLICQLSIARKEKEVEPAKYYRPLIQEGVLQ